VVPDGGNGSPVGLSEQDLEVGDDYLVPDRTGWAPAKLGTLAQYVAKHFTCGVLRQLHHEADIAWIGMRRQTPPYRLPQFLRQLLAWFGVTP
jgi:hypothetical protein